MTPSTRPIDPTRRRFVGALGAASLGAPGLLSGCLGGGNDDAPELTGSAGFEQRTLFFNLSRLGTTPTTHWLYAAGRRHALTPVADRPEVLRQARLGNAFLRAVPDASITHHAEGILFSTTAVTLAYMTCNESPETGRWEMTSMHVNIPSATAAPAYAQLSAGAGGGALPLSNKRRAYGAPAAASARDLLDEHALIDITSHAEAMVGLHPDILSIEPTSAATIHAGHIAVDPFTESLGELLQSRGPAVPAGSANIAGTPPWATLVPLLDESTQPPSPYKMSDGKLNVYSPDWSPEVEQATAQALGAVHRGVRNDPLLGIDLTGRDQLPSAEALGKVWARHDGLTSVDHPADAVQSADVLCVWKSQTTEVGLAVSELTTVVKLSDKRVQVTVNGVRNWFLRWLGMWVQFADSAGNLLPLASLPDDTVPIRPGKYPGSGDRPDAIFVGILPQVTAIFGIPVEAASFVADLKIPVEAQTVRIFYGGLGRAAAAPDAPDDIDSLGIAMTASVNYGIVGLFMAAGVSTLGPVVKLIIANGAGQIAGLLVALLGAKLNNASPLYPLTVSFLKLLVQANLPPLIGLIGATVAFEMGEMQVIDAIPIAGQIARALAAAIGALQLAETTIEVLVSPSSYRFDIALVHDLSVDVLPDPQNGGFPLPPSGYTLYRKVIYLFDRGQPHVQDAVDVDAHAARLPITLQGIPRGGLVEIKVGLYMRSSGAQAGQNDWCAGYGSTGLVSNLDDRIDPIRITQTKIPIRTDTVYLHTLKTRLDARANHAWTPTATAPPYVAPDGGQSPAISDFRAITVRQATSGTPPQKGYVGYAWKAYSTGVNDCRAPSPGQLDLLVNLATDASDNGVHAQDGYATLGCGLQAGASIAYGLLDRPDRNFYLDSDTRHIRQVTLSTPTGFADPLQGKSYGQLNHASTRVLLHPAGYIVSIDTAGSRIETLQLPEAPVSDATAAQTLRARMRSGPGTQPGLITRPLAAGISPEGAIVLVEGSAGAMRLQALDLGGNPLRYFKRQPVPYFLALAMPPGTQFLDLAIEFTGYLYLLSKDPQNAHRLDIYHPEQSGVAPICTTRGINAARLAVDLWRSVYTLNYEMLLLPDGSIPPLTEPSVSVWVPPPPT